MGVKNSKKYVSVTLIEMLIVMTIIFVVFITFTTVLTHMMRASNIVSARVVLRQEAEYLSEVFRKHIRNANSRNMSVYNRTSPRISFATGVDSGVDTFTHYTFLNSLTGSPSVASVGTEIHYVPSGSPEEVVCMGFFEDSAGRGYLVRSKAYYSDAWSSYQPNDCFKIDAPGFRDNFMVLNTDLVDIEDFSIEFVQGANNNYYIFTIIMSPQFGLGGFSSYNEDTTLPNYEYTFVVQTRRALGW